MQGMGKGGGGGQLPGAICPEPPHGSPSYIIKGSKYSNRTVTLIQQSGRYSVDNYTAEIVLTFNLEV